MEIVYMSKSKNVIRYGKYQSVLYIIIIVMTILMVGCGNKEKDGTPIDISYLNKNETKLVTETHYLKGTDTKEKIVEVLTLLCSVPETKELKATLSSGINIINYSYDAGQVTVSLGEKYKQLSKTTEVLTRAAIVRSLTAIDGVEYVMITINGEPLADLQGNPIGIMTKDMFVDNTVSQMDSLEKTVLKLYFANETGQGLIEINRELVHNADVSNVSMERLVLEQLIKGPANGDSYPTINPNTKIISVTVKDGVCYVNLDSQFLTSVGNVSGEVAIYSIVNSLVELSNVNKVQISVDGSADGKFRDKYELTTLFERNLSLLNTENEE